MRLSALDSGFHGVRAASSGPLAALLPGLLSATYLSHHPSPLGTSHPEGSRTGRESELAIACCKSTVSYGGMVRPCWPDNSIGDDRFRLRWSNQGKRAEGCGCDLVNPVAANQ